MTVSVYPCYLAGGLIAITTSFALSLDPPTPAECRAMLIADIAECNRTFIVSTDDPDADNSAAQATLEACIDGAVAASVACHHGNPATQAAREQFIDDLEECLRLYPGSTPADQASLEACLHGTINAYRVTLGLDPIDTSNTCTNTPAGALLVAPIDTLRTAALALGATDGKYPVDVNTTLSFQAGVSATGNYNFDIQPCIKQAELVAFFETKQGVKSITYDADINTSDGTFFDLPIFANRVVDAKEMNLFSIYYDENGAPVFVEYATLKIQDSPISGDWNRDQVLNSQDIADFLDSYNTQTDRADLNEDEQIDQQDAVQYLDSVAD